MIKNMSTSENYVVSPYHSYRFHGQICKICLSQKYKRSFTKCHQGQAAAFPKTDKIDQHAGIQSG